MLELKTQNHNLNLKVFFFTLISLFTIHYSLFTPAAHAQVKVKDVFKTPFADFGSLVSVVVSNLYVIAGIVILFLIIFGGFGIISGAGSGDQQKTAQGKQALTSAIIGFLIIFTSYWIIQLIELITGLSILKPNI
ncbi:hypothetical protein HYZ78_01945 [Candidatus Microgenomates bacterium]|nr:hypothetical protein [Candidatus Microgenomates bacterium]